MFKTNQPFSLQLSTHASIHSTLRQTNPPLCQFYQFSSHFCLYLIFYAFFIFYIFFIWSHIFFYSMLIFTRFLPYFYKKKFLTHGKLVKCIMENYSSSKQHHQSSIKKYLVKLFFTTTLYTFHASQPATNLRPFL